MTEILFRPMHEIKDLLARKEVSSVELTQACLHRVKKLEPQLNAFITVTQESALSKAKEVDARRNQKELLPPLAGIPVALKDNFVTKGIPTTCASKILGKFCSPYDGAATKKILEQETILIGKTNMDEFAMGSSNENSHYGPVRNPWDLERIPGGSSGGSATAVASGEVFAATGTDTGGSVRQPAALTGVVGLKPSYGRISRYGIVAFASSLDQVGMLTRDVHDTALMMNALAGFDPLDTTSAQVDVPDYTKSLSSSLKGVSIGVAEEYFGEGIQPKVRDAVLKAIDEIKKLGGEVREISLPHLRYAIPTYYLVCTAEASSNLARYDGVRYGYRSEGARTLEELYKKSRGEGFGREVKRRIMLGTFALCTGYYDAYFKKAAQVRTLITEDFRNAFQQVDVIVTPTSPSTAFKVGEKISDPLGMYLSDIYTISVNLAGLPGMSLPCGFVDGLPIGLQLIGGYMQEPKLIKVGSAYQSVTDWHNKHPSIKE
ncbi:MAG TPA: Asp-tRNA(Asn)/Glu-tRNA(Gln) amidotransferase subunit GatA [Bdellovibrionota bacterium]|nr:Asp-tRNA(Asn)/Glu-tRNA(Gln) amidotransferase subunit GatA [Bdellovibrionota bacterium]